MWNALTKAVETDVMASDMVDEGSDRAKYNAKILIISMKIELKGWQPKYAAEF